MHCHASCSAEHGSEHSRNLRSPHPSLPAPLQLPLTANPVTHAASRSFHSFRYHCLLLAVNKKRRILSRSNLSRSVCVLAALFMCARFSSIPHFVFSPFPSSHLVRTFLSRKTLLRTAQYHRTGLKPPL